MKIQTGLRKQFNNNSLVIKSRRSFIICILITLALLLIVYVRFVYFVVLDGSSSSTSSSARLGIRHEGFTYGFKRFMGDSNSESFIGDRIKVEEDIEMKKDDILKNKRFIQFGQSNRVFPDQSVDDDDIHIVFSTGCNLFQHWQAEVLLHSHLVVGQRGKITRIVSGCETEHLKREHNQYLTHPEGLGDRPVTEEELRKSVHPRFHLHITPSFPRAKEFPWINKPMGLHHWLFNADPPVNETTIIIIDPDMFFQDKMTQDGTDTLESGRIICTTGCKEKQWMGKPINPSTLSSRASKGKPVAQLYGLGGAWTSKFDIRGICGDDSPALKWTSSEGYKYFSAGPPYILHIEDMRAIMPLWVKYMYPVFDRDPGDIQADMYAYILAAAHLNLPHLLLDHFMVSAPGTSGEAWEWVNNYPKGSINCRDPLNLDKARELAIGKSKRIRIPVFQHIAQRYDYHKFDSDKNSNDPDMKKIWLFHKGHVPANIFRCDLPLIKLPPKDFVTSRQILDPGIDPKRKYFHQAYMTCVAESQINNALISWKKKFCTQEEANYKKQFMIKPGYKSCTETTAPGEEEQIDGENCWVYAKLEAEIQPDD